jgi:hypothetical protein
VGRCTCGGGWTAIEVYVQKDIKQLCGLALLGKLRNLRSALASIFLRSRPGARVRGYSLSLATRCPRLLDASGIKSIYSYRILHR